MAIRLESGLSELAVFVGPDGKEFKLHPSGYIVEFTAIPKPCGEVDLGGGVKIPAYTLSDLRVDGFPPKAGDAWVVVSPDLYVVSSLLRPDRKIATPYCYRIVERREGNRVVKVLVARGILLSSGI